MCERPYIFLFTFEKMSYRISSNECPLLWPSAGFGMSLGVALVTTMTLFQILIRDGRRINKFDVNLPHIRHF